MKKPNVLRTLALFALTMLLACLPVTPAPSPTLTSASLPSPTPPLTVTRPVPLALPAGMVVEEYRLLSFLPTEGRDFVPERGTMEAVLAVRAAERARPDPARVAMAPLDSADPNQYQGMLDGDLMTARIESANLDIGGIVYPTATLIVLRNEDEIYRMDLGIAGPVPLLRGLWLYDHHWVVEVAVGTPTGMPLGGIIVDGELLNVTYGYEEAFGFQTMAGRPFYFFQRNGRVGAVYDGREIALDYDAVHHYYCCSGAAFNPEPAENMVSFFAQRNGVWYYVEIGVYP
ncbi:MAG: hypothetical protein ABWK53_10120 [Anaerolineales bacterium]